MAEGEKKFPILMVVGLLVVGLLLASGISYFIAMKVAGNGGAKAEQKVEKEEPGIMVKVGDAKEGLVINVGGTNSGRYLKIGVVLELRPEKNAKPQEGKNLSPEEIKVLDSVVYTLRTLKIEDLDPVKQEQLKELLKVEVNKALGGERVKQVFITNFVLS